MRERLARIVRGWLAPRAEGGPEPPSSDGEAGSSPAIVPGGDGAPKAKDRARRPEPPSSGADRVERVRRKLTEKHRAAVRKLKEKARESVRVLRTPAARFERICAMRRADVLPVDEPMALITQVPRSGGTLLSQLLDGHPACHAHPYELAIGRPDKSHWPSLDLSLEPEALYRSLREKVASRSFMTGYRKRGKCRENKPDIFPFLLPPELQRAIFLDRLPGPGRTQREALDAYMTSYFNAWLDYQGLRGGKKRWVTAFVPRLITRPDSVERFFADYPQGRIIVLVRDPRSWFASARLHNARLYGDVERATEAWRESAQSALDARARHGERVIIISYEDLVAESRETLWSLADALGIERSESMLTPTFNGRPIRANSSFVVESYGILTEAASRHERNLSPEDEERIRAATHELHAKALEVRLRGGA